MEALLLHSDKAFWVWIPKVVNEASCLKSPDPLILGGVREHHFIRANQPNNRMCVSINYLSSKLATSLIVVILRKMCTSLFVCVCKTPVPQHTVQLCCSKWLIKGIQSVVF